MLHWLEKLLSQTCCQWDHKSSGDHEVDLEVWRQTMDECSKGWLSGPFSAEDVPLDATVSKRFGLKQKHTVCLIDDFSESYVHQTVTAHESPTLHTVDVAAASLAYWFLSAGETQEGILHCKCALSICPVLIGRLASVNKEGGMHIYESTIQTLRRGPISKHLSCFSAL